MSQTEAKAVIKSKRRLLRLYGQWLEAGGRRDGTPLAFSLEPKKRKRLPPPSAHQQQRIDFSTEPADEPEKVLLPQSVESSQLDYPTQKAMPAVAPGEPSMIERATPPASDDRSRSNSGWWFVIAVIVIGLIIAFSASQGGGVQSTYPDDCSFVPDSQGGSVEC